MSKITTIQDSIENYDFSSLGGKINRKFWNQMSLISGILKEKEAVYFKIEEINCFIAINLYLTGDLEDSTSIFQYCWLNDVNPFQTMKDIINDLDEKIKTYESR